MTRRIAPSLLALLLGGCHLLFPHAPAPVADGAPDRSPGSDLSLDAPVPPDLEPWSVTLPGDCAPPRWPARRLLPLPPGALLADTLESAGPDATVVLPPGDLKLGRAVTLTRERVIIRGASSDRSLTRLDAGGTAGAIRIAASQVVLADLTITNSVSVPVHVEPAGASIQGVVLYNLELSDANHALVRARSSDAGHHADDGVIACSSLSISAGYRASFSPADPCDVRGISITSSRGWQVLRNQLAGFWCLAGGTHLGEAIDLFLGTRDTLVEGNRIADAAMAIRVGIHNDLQTGKRFYPDAPCAGALVDNIDGVIRNNFISANRPPVPLVDSGISFWSSCGGKALHNTIWFNAAPNSSSIEWRYPETRVEIANNLVSHPLKARESAAATQTTNLAPIAAGWLVDPSQGDLHLTSTATGAIDAATPLAEAPLDIDGQPRAGKPDIGADER